MEGFCPCIHGGYDSKVWWHEDDGFFYYPLCVDCYKVQLTRLRVTIIKCLKLPRDLVRLICTKYYSSRVYPGYVINGLGNYQQGNKIIRSNI